MRTTSSGIRMTEPTKLIEKATAQKKRTHILTTCAIVRGTPKNEAGRLVLTHKIDPRTSTLHRKDEAHG